MSQMIDPNVKIYVHPLTGRPVVETENNEPTLTQQQFKDECDVNNIVKKFDKTGEFTHRTSKQGMYADFTELGDYQNMLDSVHRAQDAFMLLPAQVRLKFRNDPGSLIDFLKDPQNRDEAIKLGLIEKPAEPATPQLLQKQNEQNEPKNKKQKIAQPTANDED